jgi:hypothetical protein
MYWPEGEQHLVETRSLIININKKPISNCVGGNYIFNYIFILKLNLHNFLSSNIYMFRIASTVQRRVTVCWGKDFFYPSRPDPRPIHSPVKWIPGLLPGGKKNGA